MALNREQRRALLASEIDGREIEASDVETVEPVAVVSAPDAPVVAPAEAPPAWLAPLLAAITQAQQGQGIGDAIANALRENRTPMPENTPDQYPAMSVYHPGGKDVPRPSLDVPTFLGVWDADSGKALPKFPMEDTLMTDQEIRAINAIAPGSYLVERTDGQKVPVTVAVLLDALGAPRRRVLAFPQIQFDKENRNTLPRLETLATQLVGV